MVVYQRDEVATGVLTSTRQHIHPRFDVEGCNREHHELFRQLKAPTMLESAVSLGRVERE